MSTFITLVLGLAALQFAFVYATFRVRAHRGPLTLLGNSKWQGNGKIRTYSTVEIGDEVLNEVAITNSLDNYLDGALRLPGDTTLHVAGAGWGRLFGIGYRILAIELPDGKRYYTRMSLVPALLFIAVGICLIPVIGVVATDTGTLVEIQGTGEGATFPRSTLDKMLDAAMAACDQLFEVQRAALEQPYPGVLPESGEPAKKAFGS